MRHRVMPHECGACSGRTQPSWRALSRIEIVLDEDDEFAAAWPGLAPEDRELLTAAASESRASITQLARLSGQTTSRAKQIHLELVARGLFRAVALIDPSRLGRPVLAMVAVAVRGPVDRLREGLAACRGVRRLELTSDYHLWLLVSLGSRAELADFIGDLTQRSEVDCVRSEIVLRSWAPQFAYDDGMVRGAQAGSLVVVGGDPVNKLDDMDAAIVRCLATDSRLSLTTVSAEVDLSIAAVRHRLIRLIAERTVRIQIRPDTRSTAVMVVYAVCRIDRPASEVVPVVLGLPNVVAVAETTGDRCLSVQFACGSEDQIASVRSRLSSVDGICSTELIRVRQTMIDAGLW